MITKNPKQKTKVKRGKNEKSEERAMYVLVVVIRNEKGLAKENEIPEQILDKL